MAELGHEVVGVDVDSFKVDSINKGESSIVEELIEELTREMVNCGRLRATTDIEEAIVTSDMSMVCVGTPSTASGGLDLTYVKRVAEQIGSAIAKRAEYHLATVRSTVLPGTVEEVVIPILKEASGKEPLTDFGVCFHPEFLREGSSVKDFREPPKIVIGASDSKSADLLGSLYEGFDAPLFITSIRAAEMVKYADNAFHALKVVFGNEIGTLCKSLGIDSHEVMRIFCEDTKLNISPAYLMPGFAYGGSCLPKDLRALNHRARELHLELPVLSHIRGSNDAHISRVLDMILSFGKSEIGIVGLSFKPGTDDLRESPIVELTERLIGKGCRVRIFDENVSLSRLRGGNKAYIEQKLPHISTLLASDLESVTQPSQLIIIGASSPKTIEALSAGCEEKVIVDLVRLFGDTPPESSNYHGVCW